MNFRKLFYIAALISGVIACKKEETTEVAPSLDGTLKIYMLTDSGKTVQVPEFVSPGQTVTFQPSGVSIPGGGNPGYYWKVAPTMDSYDTTYSFTHTFADTLTTFSIYCYAYASGYSTSSATSSTTTVAPGPNGSIQGINYADIADKTIYVRDMPYYVKGIGTQTWTLNNMAVRSGAPFRNAEIMSEIFGRYYNYEEAKAACDSLDKDGEDWALPTLADWKTLEAYVSDNGTGKSVASKMMADATFNGTTMWEYWTVVGEITNDSGFSAIPVGYTNIASLNFKGTYEYAMFWTADEVSATEAQYTYLICNQPGLFTGVGDKTSFGASVRCIRK